MLAHDGWIRDRRLNQQTCSTHPERPSEGFFSRCRVILWFGSFWTARLLNSPLFCLVGFISPNEFISHHCPPDWPCCKLRSKSKRCVVSPSSVLRVGIDVIPIPLLIFIFDFISTRFLIYYSSIIFKLCLGCNGGFEEQVMGLISH